MKKILLLSLLAGFLSTSCLKDGLNDFDALNHIGDMSVHVTAHPVLGFPIGEGSATIYDIIKNVEISMATIEFDGDSVINFVFDTNFHSQVNLQQNKTRHSKTQMKGNEVVWKTSSILSGSSSFSIFDSIPIINESTMDVDSLIVTVKAFVKAGDEDSARIADALQRYHLQIFYDSVELEILYNDGNWQRLETGLDTLSFQDVIGGKQINVFDHVNMSDFINKRPSQFRYALKMNIALEADFFGMSDFSNYENIVDSVMVDVIDVDAQMEMRLPISAQIANMSYDSDVELSLTLDSMELLDYITLDSSILYIDIFNGIPIECLLQASLVDENDAVLYQIIDTTMAGADIVKVNNHWISNGEKETLIPIVVSQNIFNALRKTAKLRLSTKINTSDINSAGHHVSIRANDKISIRIYAKLDPSLSYELSLSDNKKGGKK